MASAVSTAVANGHEETGGGGGGGGASPAAARPHRQPRWKRHEILVLIQGKRVVEGRGRRRAHRTAAVSVVEPKWAAVSWYCRRHGVDRGAVQCRKRWSNLACDFKKIRTWEKGPGAAKGGSFWAMRNDRRRERQLPGFFDRGVYEILDGAAEVEAVSAAAAEEEGKKTLAAAEGEEEEDEEEEEEAIFDSGRTAAEDGLFSDFEQEAAAADEEEVRPRAMMVVPISERKYEPLPPESSDPGMLNDKQPTENKDKGSPPREGQKRKRTPEEGEGDTSLQNQLIEVLERNCKMLAAQLEAQNINCQLDREQRKDQADSLLGVLNKLVDALGRIADKL
ncbi:trihelix transcription factor ASR3-like [Phoenix dactylifera]|uniref:Trihelix transcription factor ASR3-like n=1 Tax=Phoenix dactylifera TaxID=42345 RepID=A0A8B9APA4_PHODC|nr:trihelix transcription factor ASR3-like [Phoenix dactylifera]